MANTAIQNRLKDLRLQRGWSQDDVARLAGISRAAVSAMENGRIVPSIAAVLELATVFGCKTEELFSLGAFGEDREERWGETHRVDPCRFWRARVGSAIVRFPVEETHIGVLPHDGVEAGGKTSIKEKAEADRTVLVAGCDPAVSLLGIGLKKAGLFRVIPLMRSSGQALEMLREGLVHFAGLHLGTARGSGGNAAVVREKLGAEYKLVRVSTWEEGVAFSRDLAFRSLRETLRRGVGWVAREAGSGAAQCQAWLEKDAPERGVNVKCVARSHRAVAEAIREGWAQAGVCVRIVAEEAGLGFLPARTEQYDLCFRRDMEEDLGVAAVLGAIRSKAFRLSLGGLPGYDVRHTGEAQDIKQ